MSKPDSATTQLRGARHALYGTRSRIGEFFRRIASIRVTPEYHGLRWLSAVIIILFLVQLVTGILLSLYYYPEPGVAYDSLRYLSGQITTGWLFRSIHHWAGDLMLVAVLAHIWFVFFRRAYASPREYEWVVGVFLVPALLAFRFTGRLLAWDTIGYESTRRGLALFEKVPIIGSWAATWLRGGEDMGTNTLSRFFTTHVLILPWLLVVMIGIHAALVYRHGLRRREP